MKVRWKVVVDGKLLVLQHSVRQVVAVSGLELRKAVMAQTAKKCPQLSPFRCLLVVDDRKANKRHELLDSEELRLKVVFPGPKFETLQMVHLVGVNDEWERWQKEQPERQKAQEAKLAEDKERVDARKAAKRAAREAAAAAAGPAGAGRGAGRGAKAAPKGPKGAKGAAKGLHKAAKAPPKAVGRGRGH